MDIPLLIATVASIGSVLGFLLSRRYMPRDPHKAAMLCGTIVIVSSAYTLVTFRVHLGLLVALTMLLLYRAFRTQRL